MGAFFTNLQIRNASTKAVCRVLPKLTAGRAYVSPPANGWVTVYAEATEDQREETICAMAAGLSRTFKTDVLGFLVHDSDIAIYWLYRCGDQLDHFNSAPDYFDTMDEGTHAEVGGDTNILLPLCVPGTTRSHLDQVLHPADGHPTFAEEIICGIAKVLGMDDQRVGLGFKYFEREGSQTFADVAEFEPIGPGTVRKVARPRSGAAGTASPQPVPDSYPMAVHMMTQRWRDESREKYAPLIGMIGGPRDKLLKELRESFDKSARDFLKKSSLANPPTFDELKAARDAGPDALAALIAAKTPETLTEIGVGATDRGLESFVAALLKHGLDPLAPVPSGRTTLEAAAKYGTDSTIYRMVKAAADGK